MPSGFKLSLSLAVPKGIRLCLLVPRVAFRHRLIISWTKIPNCHGLQLPTSRLADGQTESQDSSGWSLALKGFHSGFQESRL